VGPEEAVKLGLGTRAVADPVAEALALAKEIAKKSPQAIRAIKKLFNAAPSLDVRAAFALETDEQLLLLGSPNQMEAAMAVMQKREPSFEDPSS
jgi:enoyl-CoA hydratase/carnithine racemase